MREAQRRCQRTFHSVRASVRQHRKAHQCLAQRVARCGGLGNGTGLSVLRMPSMPTHVPTHRNPWPAVKAKS